MFRFNLWKSLRNWRKWNSGRQGLAHSRRANRASNLPLNISWLEPRILLVAEIEPNNSVAAATVFPNTGVSLTGSIASFEDVDYFSTTLAAGDTFVIGHNDNAGDAPSFLPTIDVIGPSGQVVGTAPDARQLRLVATTAGTYAVRLTGLTPFGTFVGSYQLNTTVTAFGGVSEVEGNDTPAAATLVSGSNSFRGSLSGAGDTDYFSFNGAPGQAVVIDFAAAAQLAPTVRLYAPSGALVTSDLSGAGLRSALSETGLYTFAVRSDNTNGSIVGSYNGSLFIANRPALDVEAPPTFEAATFLDLGPYIIPAQHLSPDSSFTTRGLTGSYINSNLRGDTGMDWRVSQTVAGTRIDSEIRFGQDGWGARSSLQLTGGTDDNWDEFSTQWDGYLRIDTSGTQIFTATDDGSRVWIDINRDGTFDPSGSEFLNNNWGSGQGTTLSPASVTLAAGDYRIRMQYEEGGGGNRAFLLWSDATRSAGSLPDGTQRQGLGVLTSLSDIDVYSVDFVGTGLYQFELQATNSILAAQGRLLSIYNEFGQLLETSRDGLFGSNDYHARPEWTGRHYVTVQALDESGLGAYSLNAQTIGEFPAFRDVPLFFHNYSLYSHTEDVPMFNAFFESRFDGYQIDLTNTDPGNAREHVTWMLRNNEAGNGGVGGGWYGVRSVSGGGDGNVDVDYARLADVWFGLGYHENGHAVGLPHQRHPLDVMSYGGQYDFIPIGSSNRIGGDGRVSMPKVQNERNYLDWALEAGRIVLETESNDTVGKAQALSPLISQMMTDADPRNDQAVVVGKLNSSADVDVFSLTVAAGERWAFDIDAAEFQMPLDARIEVVNASGTVLASNSGAIDRDSGISSVDPNLLHQFAQAGTYFVVVRSESATAGNYRLKVTPARAFDTTGPRVAAAWPDGDGQSDGTRQLFFWFNDQLDPSSLTSANIEVRGTTTGVRSGTATFDPITATMTWLGTAQLPPDTYTVTLKSGNGGITDLQGNWLDGETDGSLNWPQVSGNDTVGGNFTTRFTITQVDTTPAVVDYSNVFAHEHDRTMFELGFSDELDVNDLESKTVTLRGAGADGIFNTTDDTVSPTDKMYDRRGSTARPLLLVYSRGVLEPGSYRLEASLLDAAGFTVTVSNTLPVLGVVPGTNLFTSPALTTRGLTGSYVNQSLRGYAPQDDWRVTQSISGQRNDLVDFPNDGWGVRSTVGLTSGSDTNWDNFSVQWDGMITIPANGTRLYTRSDDGSRMWIDLNNDGVFNASGSEFVNNNWGFGQGATISPASTALNAGTYRIRIQYEEGGGGNNMQLMWDSPVTAGRPVLPKVVDSNITPGTVVTSFPPPAINVTFSTAMNPASLTTNSFQVRYSPNPTFFDGNDVFLTEKNGAIAWDAATRTASFEPVSPLGNGYYLIELKSDSAGISSLGGHRLDGEYRDANIAGFTPQYGWQRAPSGDGIAGGDYRAAFTIANSGVNTAPVIGGAVTNQTVNDNATIAPFTTLTVTDPDNQNMFARVTILNGAVRGDFTAATTVGWTRTTVGNDIIYSRFYNPAVGVAATVQAAIRTFVFQPRSNAIKPNTTEATAFSIFISDGTATATNNQTLVITTSVNDAPSFAGANPSVAVNDNATVSPFNTLTVSEVDNQEALARVTILNGAVRGDFTNAIANGWTRSTVGNNVSYVKYFNPGLNIGAAVQAAFRALIFLPRSNAIKPGTTELTDFLVTLSDGVATPALNQGTRVVSTSVNDSPVITGAVANQIMNDNTTKAVFSTLTVTDPDLQETLVRVTINSGTTRGDFTPASSVGWTRSISGGNIVYSRYYNPSANIGATVQTAIRALIFQPRTNVPIGTNETTLFTVFINDGLVSATNSQTSIITTGVAPRLAVAPIILDNEITTVVVPSVKRPMTNPLSRLLKRSR